MSERAKSIKQLTAIKAAVNAIYDAREKDHTPMSDHLWIEDGERIVCTHCGIGLKEGVGDECQAD